MPVPPARRPRLLSLPVLVGLLAACGSEGPAPTEPIDESVLTCAAAPDPHCDHPVDALLVPRLRKLGISVRDAEPAELCRRMHVDLIGRGPNPAELNACLAMSPSEMADALFAEPDYERVQQRYWARELGIRAGQTIFWQIFDLDRLVGELIDDTIGYAEFASRALVHPAFFSTRLDGSWAAGVYEVFLGRPARRDEIDGLAPLGRPLLGRIVCDGRSGANLYLACLDAEARGEPFDQPCEPACELLQIEGGLIPCLCEPAPFAGEGDGGPFFGCAGDGLGEMVSLAGMECVEVDYALYRLIDETAGGFDRCPDREQPCPDMAFVDGQDYETFPAEPLPAAGAAAHEGLLAIGEALAQRRDFWEAAVDRELRRLLGWWRSGFRQPDFDLPAVRALLAAELERTGSLRHIQRLILTSLLYIAPAEAPVDAATGVPLADPPPWSTGPVKLLAGETWLDTASAVVGERLGLCDHRFIDPNPEAADAFAFLTEAADFVATTIDPLQVLAELDLLEELTDEQIAAGYVAIYALTDYRALARSLDGCLATHEPRSPSLSLISAESEAASTLCALGREVVPRGFDSRDDSDEALDRATRHLYERALARLPAADETGLLRAEMRACLDEGACADVEVAARWLCARLLDSTLFASY